MESSQPAPIIFERSDIIPPGEADESMNLPIDPQSAATLAKFAGQALNTYGKIEESSTSRYKADRELERDLKAIQAWKDNNENEHVRALKQINKKHKKQMKKLDNESKSIDSKHKTNMRIIDTVDKIVPLLSQSETQNADIIGEALSQLINRID